jgi:hypothetical protein
MAVFVMLCGLFCARSIDVPAVLASFYECNGFLTATAFLPWLGLYT